MKALSKSFFKQESTQVAEQLIGSYLVHSLLISPIGNASNKSLGKQTLIGRIVETEAYLGLKDPCCHSYGGLYTKRTQAMYLPGGHSYVYFTYGMHYCFNVVTGTTKQPEAVLIRALEPVKGLSVMKKNRNKELVEELCSGPAKVCQAFAITKDLNAKDLTKNSNFFIAKGDPIKNIETDARVGLAWHKDSAYWFLRFYIKNHPCVSVKKNQIT